MIEYLSGLSGTARYRDGGEISIADWSITHQPFDPARSILGEWSGQFVASEDLPSMDRDTVQLSLDGIDGRTWTGKAIVTRIQIMSRLVSIDGTGPLIVSEG